MQPACCGLEDHSCWDTMNLCKTDLLTSCSSPSVRESKCLVTPPFPFAMAWRHFIFQLCIFLWVSMATSLRRVCVSTWLGQPLWFEGRPAAWLYSSSSQTPEDGILQGNLVFKDMFQNGLLVSFVLRGNSLGTAQLGETSICASSYRVLWVRAGESRWQQLKTGCAKWEQWKYSRWQQVKVGDKRSGGLVRRKASCLTLQSLIFEH